MQYCTYHSGKRGSQPGTAAAVEQGTYLYVEAAQCRGTAIITAVVYVYPG